MGKEIVFDYSKTAGFISEEEMKNMKSTVMGAKDVLTAKSGAGNDYLGWIDLPVDYDKEEFARIKKAAEKIQGDSDVLLVIGIGGSYLGARAAIEFLSHSFYNVLPKGKRKTPEIYFVGNSISSKYIHDLQDVLEGKDFSINIRHNHRAGDRFPRIQGNADRQVWQGRGQQENLCDHRQGKGSFKESGKRRGIRELRCSG